MTLEDLPLFQKTEPPKHWTVSELTARIRGVIEPAFTEIWVQGEISNYRPAASGHAYFSLKDDGSMIAAAAFGWGARGKKQSFALQDGLQVLCRGRVSVYPPRGSYQLVVDQIEPLGAGALQLAFEQLKAKLSAEGLFDPRRKKPLPPYPKTIAVVTSPSGAAIRDMLNILKRRAPNVRVLVIPAVVQGDDAPAQLLRGLDAANKYRLGDVIVLARGGGSIEDLWGFNDERLARAIAASALPVVSAVGHEIDFTIADFVADLRAPTPSAAAEILSGHWVDVRKQLAQSAERARSLVVRDLAGRKQFLAHLAARVVNPADRLREQAQRLDEFAFRMERAIRARLERRRKETEILAHRLPSPRHRLDAIRERLAEIRAALLRGMDQAIERRRFAFGQLSGKLEALSPLKVLDRGYSIARTKEGKVLKSVKQAKPKQKFWVNFEDGKAEAEFL